MSGFLDMGSAEVYEIFQKKWLKAAIKIFLHSTMIKTIKSSLIFFLFLNNGISNSTSTRLAVHKNPTMYNIGGVLANNDSQTNFGYIIDVRVRLEIFQNVTNTNDKSLHSSI